MVPSFPLFTSSRSRITSVSSSLSSYHPYLSLVGIFFLSLNFSDLFLKQNNGWSGTPYVPGSTLSR